MRPRNGSGAAAVFGAIQFAVAVRGRTQGGRLPLIVSGGLSTIAGGSLIRRSGSDSAHLAAIGGYMALGAVFYLASAAPGRGRRSWPWRIVGGRLNG